MAKLTGLATPEQRELGFYPIQLRSDLLEPTDDTCIKLEKALSLYPIWLK